MKCNIDDINEALEFINEIEQYKPIAENVIRILYEFTPLLKDLFINYNIFTVELYTKIFRMYMQNGFTREEAFQLTLKSQNDMKDFVGKLSYNRETK